MLRRGRQAELPGADAVSIGHFGWSETGRSDSVRTWADAADSLSLFYFPVEPDLVRAPGDDEALCQQMQAHSPDAGVALIECAWVEGPSAMPLALTIMKRAQPGGGMTYVGSLIVAFATCSWVAQLQCAEVGATGMREVIWLNDHLSRGGTLEDSGLALGSSPDQGQPPQVVRVPADDSQYDALVPMHPLSRVRRLLPELQQSIELAKEAKRLAPFA